MMATIIIIIMVIMMMITAKMIPIAKVLKRF